jgi:hypothetical protein
MADKPEICGLHCPEIMLWAFTVVGLWFSLSAFKIPTVGNFWSWMVFLSGICASICITSKKHQKTGCPFSGVHPGVAIAGAVIGCLFLLGDVGLVPMFDLNLLYVMTFLIGLGILTHRMPTRDKTDPSYGRWRWRTYLSNK